MTETHPVTETAPANVAARTWWICSLLLLASTINYMDRQTLSTTATRIKAEFVLSDEQYGLLELAFGWAFAVGATLFGVIADRTNIRWLYPAVLLAWSVMGFSTGLVQSYAGLLVCRLFLGLFEAGHWPCALKTTQRLLPPSKRTLGNSVLQSGTAIGAIVTPLIVKAMLTDEPGSWRPAFQLIGLIGVGWVALWLLTIRGRELAPLPPSRDQASPVSFEFAAILRSRRFWTLLVVVILINLCYHFFRVWLPIFLREGRGYSETAMLNFLFWFYIANDVGCLAAGFATAALALRGWPVHRGRLLVFSIAGLCCALAAFIPLLDAGPLLLGLLLVISMGLLGLFPCYYAFSQELTVRHQGKVTGLLGTMAWLTTSPMHPLFGRWIDYTGRHDLGLAAVGLLPLVAAVAIAVGWGRDRE
jgi:MFS transporter, ACS family, hexuronate transporter